MTALALLLAACTADPKDPPDRPVDDTDPAVTDTDPPVDDTDPTDPPPTPCAPGVAAQIGAAAFPDVQAALDAAGAGDTVDVCPGTWVGNFAWRGQGPLTVQGFTGDPADVTLDGDPDVVGLTPAFNGRVLHLDPDGGDLTVRGLTFTRADNDLAYGGALVLTGDPTNPRGDVLIEDCVLTDSFAALDGAALYVDAVRHVTLRRLDVLRNTTGVGAAATLTRLVDGVVAEDLRVHDNHGGGAAGLAIYHASRAPSPYAVDLRRLDVQRNTATDDALGAGLLVSVDAPADHSVTLADSTFRDNETTQSPAFYNPPAPGGAVYVGNRSSTGTIDLRVDRCTFDANRGVRIAHLALGLSEFSPGSQATLTDTSFHRADRATGLPPEAFDNPIAAAALGHYVRPTRDDTTLLTLVNVDLGDGPTANAYDAIARCGPATGLVNAVLTGAVLCP